jgi:MFS family permease
MGLLMPITGQIYDRIGPRWPVVCGLAIAAVATYLLHTITLDTSREHLMWLLMLQYGGFGIGMMPLFSAGLAVIPPTYNNTASAFNNVVQRTAAALGVAVFTAVLTRQQAELMAGRAALLPQDTPVPHLGPPGTPDWTGLYALYHQTELRVFVGAINNVFLIMAGICALGVLGALLLRSGRVPTLPAETVPPAQPVSQSLPTNGDLDDQLRLMPSVAATGRLDTRPEDG